MSARRKQEGVVLLVALVALVMLSFIAMRQFRAVDVNSRLSGNIAFRQGATQAADRGIQAAAYWLSTRSVQNLSSDDPAAGYYSAMPAPEPNWLQNANWGSGRANELPRDEAGNVVEFQIHRLCQVANAPPTVAQGAAAGNECVAGSPASVSGGSSRRAGSETTYSNPQVQYRVTVRVKGPRGAMSVVQTMLLGPS